MKKILIATTALVATAGVAAADITLGGMARIGFVSSEAAVAAGRTNIVDNRVQFDLRGKIEVGELTFGSHIRMRSTNGVATLNAGQASISSAGLTVFAGNIPGALESMPNVYASTVGYSGGTFQGAVTGGDTMAYSGTGTGAQGIQANYKVGDLTVMAAYQPSTENTQLAVSYSSSGLTVAVGAQLSDLAASEVMVATLGYKLGDVTVAVAYGDNNGITHTTGSIAGSFEGVGVKAYVSQKDGAAGDAYGVGVSYSLGGGASLGAGFENTFAGTSRVEAGITFGF